ncbi:MAG: MFS transporter [Epulopiscium sp.]|nr:MFS transporter [Candidatus Epulonipiscium sp.]
MNTKERNLLFARCFYTFFVSGMSVLIIGAILPYLIKETNMNYTVAGGLLSAFAIGNLLASFFSPFLASKIGKKATVILLSSLIPIGLTIVTFLPSVAILYPTFLFIGIGRGSISNFNNGVINDHSDGKPLALNLLHTFFALGAFLAPFMTSTMIRLDYTWKHVLYVMIFLCWTSVITYITMKLFDTTTTKKNTAVSEKPASTFLKSFDFYCIGLILFFYLGVENCINGWFVTYLQSIGVMSEAFATNLVSITWFVIMIGRLTTGYLSTKIPKKTLILINCIGSTLAFFLLISTKNIVWITVAIVALGFFLAGIYPTSIANASFLIKGSASGMALLLAIAAMGGIIAPQVVGWIADSLGIVAAISFLIINVILMVLFATINYKRKIIE